MVPSTGKLVHVPALLAYLVRLPGRSAEDVWQGRLNRVRLDSARLQGWQRPHMLAPAGEVRICEPKQGIGVPLPTHCSGTALLLTYLFYLDI